MAIILIVDDDPTIREALAEAVRDLGHETREAASGVEALECLRSARVHAVFLDLRMPGMDGLELLGRIRAREAPPIVAVLTAHATAANTIEAMRLGAFDHLTKPIGRADIARVVTRMLSATSGPQGDAAPSSERLVGSSEAMRSVQKSIGLLADSETTLLIQGETGTGKELIARAIHEFGSRKAGPFIAVNCASIPSELMESELFGHAKGAFTGAVSERIGAFRQAHRGTLLLDEIGDMDLALQTKILRALQERIITPVGGKPSEVDVRVIAATHRDLKARVSEGLFREDLFYRLYVVPIDLPPLRERIADIVPLAEHFLTLSAPAKKLSADAAAALVRHHWPGNVRELKNAMERASVLTRGNQVTSADLGFLADCNAPRGHLLDWPDEDLPSAVARLEEMLIRRAIERCSGNRSEAAKLLNINRQLLYAKLKRYGLTENDEHAGADERFGAAAAR
jgi:two-component system NtrC family response regulator